jgi:hypothetical protein
VVWVLEKVVGAAESEIFDDGGAQIKDERREFCLRAASI